MKYSGECAFCDLGGADLSEAILYRADLTGANLTGADLFGVEANLSGARMNAHHLQHADAIRY